MLLTPLANLLPLSLIPVANFSTGVLETSGKLPLVSLTQVANLPPVSTTLAKLVANLLPMSMILGCKVATGVVDTAGAP